LITIGAGASSRAVVLFSSEAEGEVEVEGEDEAFDDSPVESRLADVRVSSTLALA
jgi:hypothetical protein